MSEFAQLRQLLNELAPVSGVTPVDMLQLPDHVGGAMRKMMRAAMTGAEFGQELGLPAEEGEALAELLAQKGYLRRQSEAAPAGEARFVVSFAHMRPRPIPPDP